MLVDALTRDGPLELPETALGLAKSFLVAIAACDKIFSKLGNLQSILFRGIDMYYKCLFQLTDSTVIANLPDLYALTNDDFKELHQTEMLELEDKEDIVEEDDMLALDDAQGNEKSKTKKAREQKNDDKKKKGSQEPKRRAMINSLNAADL